jgi:hypothetical protein
MAHEPSDVSPHVGHFDRFASWASNIVSKAPFFALCVLMIVVWAPTILFFPIDTWQLIINTATTIVTFLLVALLQNTQSRNDQAIQAKLNAIAKGLADLMCFQAESNSGANGRVRELADDEEELRKAVGLEGRESS